MPLARKTVFIVGAGASTEFELGAGDKLANDIRELLQAKTAEPQGWIGEGSFENAIRDLGTSDREVITASETIRRGLHFSNSIDDFLHDNREKELVVQLGKLAIAHCMLTQESRASRLHQLNADSIQVRAQAFDALRNTWLDKLFRLLKRGCTPNDADAVFGGASFIVFNYDRCIEQFLFHALGDALDLSPDLARATAERIQIEHVYGGLGPLPWASAAGGVPFAEVRADITRLAKGIKTYSEEISGTSHAIIRGLLDEAEQIVFLGYAFHEQGMSLLFPAEGPQGYPRVFWTRLGVHDAVIERVRTRVVRSDSFDIPAKCVAALDQWQFELLKG
jgi:hypothetical protein